MERCDGPAAGASGPAGLSCMPRTDERPFGHQRQKPRIPLRMGRQPGAPPPKRIRSRRSRGPQGASDIWEFGRRPGSPVYAFTNACRMIRSALATSYSAAMWSTTPASCFTVTRKASRSRCVPGRGRNISTRPATTPWSPAGCRPRRWLP
jgi:hypothetical protein